MDIKYINPFVESFEAIMPQLRFENLQKGNLSVKGQELTNTGVNIVVGMVGAIKGNVVYSINFESAKKIASMMIGMPVDELDDMANSALSELANMLTANAATSFYNSGIQMEISTPTLLYGTNITIKMSSSQVLCIELSADGNVMEINIAFEK
jgi:chemotaxis protein CheX